jgi:hypothetical protein
MSDDDESRQTAEIEINMDIDTWAQKQRVLDIGGEIVDTTEWGKCVKLPTINYPRGMCKSLQIRDHIECSKLGIKPPEFVPSFDKPDVPTVGKKRKAMDVYAAVGSKQLKTV